MVEVAVVRRGGIAGVARRGTVDTREVGGGDETERLLGQLPFGRPPRPGPPDRFEYEITVTDGTGSRTARVGEAELPGGLRPLVDAALARGTTG